MTKEFISNSFEKLQETIVRDLESLDRTLNFTSDLWNRVEGGGGRTMAGTNGAILEKGGVAFSAVHGEVSPEMEKQLNLKGSIFYATGVSIVIHPINPFVPIIHMNIRYFELDNGTFWFGGGIDLTPHYIDQKMAQKFHFRLKNICDKYEENFYSNFKSQADDYFFIPHRNETRGVGGIFFDHLNDSTGISKESIFNFCMDLGQSFTSIYSEQVEFGKNKEFNEANIQWRNHRRGRYVEFNLVNDRGTKFGLVSGGRTESILMSLPPLAEWTYCFKCMDQSLEEKTQQQLKKGIDWLTIA